MLHGEGLGFVGAQTVHPQEEEGWPRTWTHMLVWPALLLASVFTGNEEAREGEEKG